MTFRSLAEMKQKLQGAIDDALKREVLEAVKDAQQDAIEDVVYDVYPKPSLYIRRRKAGGLQDKGNMTGKLRRSGVLAVSNETLFSNGAKTRYGRSLAKVVVTGRGYQFRGYGYGYEQPRDFVQGTRERLNTSEMLKKALKDGLERQGYRLE